MDFTRVFSPRRIIIVKNVFYWYTKALHRFTLPTKINATIIIIMRSTYIFSYYFVLFLLVQRAAYAFRAGKRLSYTHICIYIPPASYFTNPTIQIIRREAVSVSYRLSLRRLLRRLLYQLSLPNNICGVHCMTAHTSVAGPFFLSSDNNTSANNVG